MNFNFTKNASEKTDEGTEYFRSNIIIIKGFCFCFRRVAFSDDEIDLDQEVKKEENLNEKVEEEMQNKKENESKGDEKQVNIS